MSTNKMEIQFLIEKAFMAAIDKLAKEESDGNSVNDLYVQADAGNGEFRIYDEEERLIEKTVIPEWENPSDKDDEFNKRVITSVKPVLAALSAKGVFDIPRLVKPLSISLTDEDFIIIEELLFLDENMLRLDDPLLKDLDEDLDNFLDDLLADIK